MEKYIFVKSDECRDYYPENKPYDFKIHLDNALDLQGFWKIGITEFFTLSSTKKTVIDALTSKPITTFQHKSLFLIQMCVIFQASMAINNLCFESSKRIHLTVGMTNFILRTTFPLGSLTFLTYICI